MLINEIAVMRGLQDVLNTPVRQAIVIFCARWLIFIFVFLAAATSLYRRRPALRQVAYEAAWAGILALALALILERVIGRVRPFLASSDISLLIPPPKTFSFPSGHASVAFAAALAFARGHKWLGWLAISSAVLIAGGRVAAGVHYPSDVLAGVIVGVIAVGLVRASQRALRTRDVRIR